MDKMNEAEEIEISEDSLDTDETTGVKRTRLGDILVKEGIISDAKLSDALTKQKETKKRLGTTLVEMGIASEMEIVKAFSNQLNTPYIDISNIEPDPVALKIIPESLAKRYLTLPLTLEGDYLTIAMADPTDIALKDAIEYATDKKLKLKVSTPTLIRKSIQKFYEGIKIEKLGDILLKDKIITSDQLKKALKIQDGDSTKKLGDVLINMGFCSEKDIVKAYSKQLGITYTDLSKAKPDPKAIETVPIGVAERYLIMPITIIKRVLVLAMADPLDIRSINAITIATNKIIKVTVSGAKEIKDAINRYYNRNALSAKLGFIPVSNELAQGKTADIKNGKPGIVGGKRKLEDIIVDSGLINQDKLNYLIHEQKKTKKKITDLMLEYGMATEVDVAVALSQYHNIPYIELSDVDIESNAYKAIPENIALKHLIMPIAIDERTITVAVSNPSDTESIDALAFITGKSVKLRLSTTVEIRKAIHRYYHNTVKKKLGDMLIEMGLLSEDGLHEALEKQKESKKKLGDILAKDGYVKESDIYKAYANQLGIPYTDLDIIVPSPEAIKLISEDIAERYQIIPLSIDKNDLIVTMSNPLNLDTLGFLRRTTGRNIRVTISSPSQIALAINKNYQFGSMMKELESIDVVDAKEDTAEDDGKTDMGPIVRMVDTIIIQAVKGGVSDIHLEVKEDNTVVRYRVDGVLREVNQFPKKFMTPIVSRIKIMSNLDISEKRLPQDGKIKFMIDKKVVELRVATLPVVKGEAVVMRILASGKTMPMKELNLAQRCYDELEKVIQKPYGIILVVGPTGSGKTTTLHSVLGHINTPERKIWTAEDPVEITQPGLNQVEVKPKIGYDFARAMRAFLRADPDVIMVGEMRDEETASTAVEASLTGHLVLSTLHTNSAPETITRLIDIGIDPFNFADALLAILAQRLVRTLCGKCKQRYTPDEDEFNIIAETYGADIFPELGVKSHKDAVLYKKKGCDACNHTGYKGRTGIHELLVGTEDVKRLIQQKSTVEYIRKQAIKDGMRTLMQDGIYKVIKGQTDIHQVRRVCM
ncbi:type II secretory pathway, ATPase PulE/Tfp pilus assembly pathway, ATPase PilB [Candidatus Magnetoovum chiemensis]|nr:type II secretory pathway, ATPase PulE/Tfp pilus assembly pathway, ATPase PilB [Candidatus Magnetoovum chiemensis]